MIVTGVGQLLVGVERVAAVQQVGGLVHVRFPS